MTTAPALHGLSLANALLVLALLGSTPVTAAPEHDRERFVAFFQQRFPQLALQDYKNGAYALDPDARAQWRELMEFPPYEFGLAQGEEAFHRPMRDGATYADCLGQPDGVRQRFPYFDAQEGAVVTLELALNRCREASGEAPLPYGGGELAALSAYLARESHGRPLEVTVPDDPAALAAYRAGKRFYYSRHGSLNLACSSCHLQAAGRRLGGTTVSPALGQPGHWPAYRLEWGELGTLQRRFAACHAQTGARAFAPQSETYRNLEYFLSYMNNGLAIDAPGLRQ